MSTEAAMTPAPVGNDSVRPSLSLDDASEIDFDDPEQDTNEADQTAQSESETDEAGSGQETDEIDASAAEADDDETDAEDAGEAETSTPEPGDDVSVTVNGEKLTLNELKRGYLREGDYTRKTQVVSQREKDLEALATRVTHSVNAIAEHLTKTLPAAPDPQLAVTNPNEYIRRKALHEHAMGQIAEVLKVAQAPRDATDKLTQQQHKALIEAETAKLQSAFPQTMTQEGHKKFFDAAASAARKLGYSEEEIGAATDHRLFALAHYARIGLQAEAAKAKAKQKVVNAPPVAPARRQPGQQVNGQKNREAMKKLRQSGSIDDAVNIDWD